MITFEIKEFETHHIYKEKMLLKDFIAFVYRYNNKFEFLILNNK